MDWTDLGLAAFCLFAGWFIGFGMGKAWGIGLGWSRGYHAARAFYALKTRHEQRFDNIRF